MILYYKPKQIMIYTAKHDKKTNKHKFVHVFLPLIIPQEYVNLNIISFYKQNWKVEKKKTVTHAQPIA
jgi:hypothetical protein